MSDRVKLEQTILQLIKIQALEDVVVNLHGKNKSYNKAVADPNGTDGSYTPVLLFWGGVSVAAVYFTWEWWLFFRILLYSVIFIGVCGVLIFGDLKTERQWKKDKKKEHQRLIKKGLVDEKRIQKAEKEVEVAYNDLYQISPLSKRYLSIPICHTLLQYFNEGRVHSLKEALNIWETEQRHQENLSVKQQQMQQIEKNEKEKQKRHEENLRVMNDMRYEMEKTRDEIERNRHW